MKSNTSLFLSRLGIPVTKMKISQSRCLTQCTLNSLNVFVLEMHVSLIQQILFYNILNSTFSKIFIWKKSVDGLCKTIIIEHMHNKSKKKKKYYVCVEVDIDTKDVFQSASRLANELVSETIAPFYPFENWS